MTLSVTKKEDFLPPLSKRLAAAVSMVGKGNRAADVGCDHGYTAIYLRLAGISPFCICTDIHRGPLEAASENIRKFGVSDIETRLCDGLNGVGPGEADTVIITGMGGELICRILEDGKEVVRQAKELVLGPQSEPEKVRKKVYELGFAIADEAFVREDGKYYPVIRAFRRGNICREDGDSGAPGVERDFIGAENEIPGEAEMLFGPVLLARRSPELKEFLEREKARYETVLAHLDAFGGRSEDRSKDRARRAEEIRLVLALIEEALEYYR